MSIENLPIIQEIARKLRNFDHPSIDSSKTEVKILPAQQSAVLEVKLYDLDGHSIVQDVPIGDGYAVPGMQVSIYPYSKRIHIENCYVQPQYHGRRIGTAFVSHLMTSARQVKIKNASLVADTETDAAPYWKKIHHFEEKDPNHPQYLEKKI
jgi:ribosomal protein S18 acetylase RimI-like enzyme